MRNPHPDLPKSFVKILEMAAIESVLVCMLLVLAAPALALSPSFYSSSCPNLTTIVKSEVRKVVQSEPRMCASLIRLFFHDCFVLGCDASILLDGASLEQNALPNINSIRGLDVVDRIKAEVEGQCSGKVSCADLLALIARDCVVELNGPSWTVNFGRRDSLTASQSAANSDLPSPFSNVSTLITAFQNKNLSIRDLVALSGAHTVGQSQCSSFKQRLYGPSQGWDCMDPNFNASLRNACPSSGGDTNLSPLDQTPVTFDNKYFVNLLRCKGLLFSDQTLVTGWNWDTASLVDTYASDQAAFFQDFATAMVKMGNINPITAPNGQIRRQCGKVN